MRTGMFLLVAAITASAEVPVLTVCEALQDLHRYSGQNVIVVGLAVGTMHGFWISANCGFKVQSEALDFVEAREYETLISASYTEGDPVPNLPTDFKWDDRQLQQKVRMLRRTSKRQTARKFGIWKVPVDEWGAIFGRLETVQYRLRVEGKLRIVDHLGFGHGSEAPAQIVWPRDGYRKLK